MNRLLLWASEVDAAGRAVLADRRAEHVRNVLHGRVGQTVRVGVVNGKAGVAAIEALDAGQVTLRWTADEPLPPAPRVDLLLALPRPKVMRRLWAPLASLGVGRVVLLNAARVARDYFDTHWLDPAVYGALLLEGLEQSGDTRLPAVSVERRLRPFLEDQLDGRFPASVRLLAQPGDGDPLTAQRVAAGQRVLLAVGPEGGWTEFEIGLLEARGFRQVGMGWRTLRSDTACVALLALAHELVRRGEPAPARGDGAGD